MFNQTMDQYFIEVLENLGPTIIGVKPAELLNIKLGAWPKLKRTIEKHPRIGFLPIKKLKKNPRIQILFYHKEGLEKVLEKKVNQRFLIKQDYPEDFSLEQYLAVLKNRLRSENFPHEIGVFLGYPLKDVLGYMGYPLKLVEINGWHYYGSRRLSQEHYENIKREKKNFGNLLRSIKKPEEFYNYLS